MLGNAQPFPPLQTFQSFFCTPPPDVLGGASVGAWHGRSAWRLGGSWVGVGMNESVSVEIRDSEGGRGEDGGVTSTARLY